MSHGKLEHKIMGRGRSWKDACSRLAHWHNLMASVVVIQKFVNWTWPTFAKDSQRLDC
jgi:hypothetical protein